MSSGATVKVPPELSQAAARFEHFGGERAAVLARMVHAVTDLAASCDARTIKEVAGVESNDRLLFQVLQKAPPAKADPAVAAKLRGVEAKRSLLESDGGTLSAEELGELLGITRQAVDKRRRAGKLLAIAVNGRGLRYPAWQVHSGQLLGGLEDVLAALEPDSPLMHIQFFLSGNYALEGKRPLDLLRRGQRLKDVLRAAKVLDTHGAP